MRRTPNVSRATRAPPKSRSVWSASSLLALSAWPGRTRAGASPARSKGFASSRAGERVAKRLECAAFPRSAPPFPCHRNHGFKMRNYSAPVHVLCPKPARAGAPERRLQPALRARSPRSLATPRWSRGVPLSLPLNPNSSTMLDFLGARLNAGGGCPGGTLDNSPAFQRRGSQKDGSRPEGTTEQSPGIQPSLRDELTLLCRTPGVETDFSEGQLIRHFGYLKRKSSLKL
jgi:hypothetical protein